MKNTTTLQSKRSITVLLGVLLYFSSLSAQTMQDTIIANFSLMERIPKEKWYLHLDKPFYGAGEKIWFKGYLVNAITHQNNAQSNFIITELILSLIHIYSGTGMPSDIERGKKTS